MPDFTGNRFHETQVDTFLWILCSCSFFNKLSDASRQECNVWGVINLEIHQVGQELQRGEGNAATIASYLLWVTVPVAS
ncbi:hypothetical protein CEXT_649201 [Caerostris extrusa]|uniref:Uncharacterized protein n=1 Tax=Caerostris extrusa TaxID=172846 RepID=A0AAV4NT37_CAEEX|nr:hypothetical protein CEXT_649201 [Caerostris extrusa]